MSAARRSPAWLLGPLAIVAVAMLATPGAGARVAVPGSQGTDTSLPATDSQVTVNGSGAFANMAFTVNQTTKLSNQAISVTWTGGTTTVQNPNRFGSHYVQIMQCWGDDDGAVPGNPGPPPEQCVQGAVTGQYGGVSSAGLPEGFATQRLISNSTWANFESGVGYLDPASQFVWRPFRGVDGTEITVHYDSTFNPSDVGGNFWLNPYFNIITTNEIAAGATGLDGRGAELFEVQTGVQSSGLGCGQKTQTVAGGEKTIPKCWLVIVPRGSAVDENLGTPYGGSGAESSGVTTSPLSSIAWKNRVAVPLEFNPVDSPCSLAADSREIAGSELALPAVANWQPLLCASGELPPFSYGLVGDSAARQQLAQKAPGGPGMVVVSQPLSSASIDPASPIVYAPLTVSGLVIGFNIERTATPQAPVGQERLDGVRVADLNLTPRLVAKLLTQSYRNAVTIISPPEYEWVKSNPVHLGVDPDFVQFNPEFAQLEIPDGRTFAGLQLPAGNSDAAQQIWKWVLADTEARAWLDGAPDPWGMKVNTVYATTTAANSTGFAFGDPAPNSFPKADPYCFQAPTGGSTGRVVPPVLCGTDWIPYARSFFDAARTGRIAFDGARVNQNRFAPSANLAWRRGVPQAIGRRAMLVLTDTSSVARFGLQAARLSRAGDNDTERTFVAADGAGLVAGVEAMSTGTEQTVLEPNPATLSPGAYPLTLLTYAAIRPLALDAQARAEYAAFLDYAVGPGQVPGLEPGRLPIGYVPLPSRLKAQSVAAADLVRTMAAAPQPAAPSTAVDTPTVDNPAVDTPTVYNPTVDNPTPADTASGQFPGTALGTQSTQPVPRRNTPTNSGGGTSTAAVPTNTEVPAATGVPASTEVLASSEAPIDQADEPVSSGAAAALTPIVDLAGNRYAVSGLGIVALGSALGALEITKRPRRKSVDGPGNATVPGEIELE